MSDSSTSSDQPDEQSFEGTPVDVGSRQTDVTAYVGDRGIVVDIPDDVDSFTMFWYDAMRLYRLFEENRLPGPACVACNDVVKAEYEQHMNDDEWIPVCQEHVEPVNRTVRYVGGDS